MRLTNITDKPKFRSELEPYPKYKGCMFKFSFLNLMDINCLEINLSLIKNNKQYPKLNKGTINLYHMLFNIPKSIHVVWS